MYNRHYITSIQDLNNKSVVLHISDKVILRSLAEILEDCVNFREITKLIDKRAFYIKNNCVRFVNDLDELFTLIQMDYAVKILYQDIIGLYCEVRYNDK